METVYPTVGQLGCILLGLWWIVVQTRYDAWIRDPLSRRIATHISLYFLLPGSMSLFALQSNAGAVWRIVFIVAGVIGIVECMALLQVARFRRGSGSRRWHIAAISLYALIAMIALVPQIARWLGFAPLTATGMLIALLLILGASYAWALFIEPPPSAQ